MSHSSFLSTVRAWELDEVSRRFPSPRSPRGNRTLLELGAGTGQQARMLQSRGYDVTAIDLPSSHYYRERVFPVTDYDGVAVPFADRSFDVVFSSNVLEHVVQLDRVLGELRRVMADDGIAVHVLPSPACRLWSIPAHYVWMARRIAAAMPKERAKHGGTGALQVQPKVPASAREWLSTLFPQRHGERGSALTEPYYYSRRWWRAAFERNGFLVEQVQGNRLFYTMANSLAHQLPMGARSRLSGLLGSACNIFVLRKEGSPHDA